LSPKRAKVSVGGPSTTVAANDATTSPTGAPRHAQSTAPATTPSSVASATPIAPEPSGLRQPQLRVGTQDPGTTAPPAPNTPAGPPDDPSPPVFTLANRVLAILDDNGLQLSTAHVDAGIAEVGFWDRRTQPAAAAATLTVGGSTVAAGATAPLHFTMVDKPYHVGVAVAGNATGVTRPLYADVKPFVNNEGSGFHLRVDATLGHNGFAIQERGSRVGDEPYWSTDTRGAPLANRVWITVEARPNERPTLHVTPTDNVAHTLTIVGYGHFKNGDLEAGQGEKTFQLPFRNKISGWSSSNKYVLQYSYPDASVRELVVWMLPLS